MIRTPTVFVLGAGASRPYGFPTGRELVQRILDGLCPGKRLHDLLTEPPCAFATDRLIRFRDELRKSRRSSIDSFLEARPQFVSIGKAAMAIELMPLEHDDALLTAKPEEDWYSYLFDQMMKEDFNRNRLSIITFNFDRSFERALFQSLQLAYGLDDEECSNRCYRVQVVHFHGDLGEPSWYVDSNAPHEDSRDYGCESDIPERETIMWCAGRIRLGSEAAITERIDDAHAMLERARRVCFIGFGYDRRALYRLGAPALMSGKVIRGTALGIPRGERGLIESSFDKIQLYDLSALDFLREVEGVLHE